MNVPRCSGLRWNAALSLAAAGVALALSGCGKPPEARFVSSARTDDLIQQVRGPVQASVVEYFGTPQDLVAWLRLPVDYGTLEGTAAGPLKDDSGEPIDPNAFVADWKSQDADKTLQQFDLRKTGVLWDSGELVGAMTGSGKKQTPVEFHVISAKPDGERSALYLNADMGGLPDPGDAFRVVGYNLQYGRQLYMQHCMHCHGVSGDGNGPTAPYLNPRPRDYRLGIFKFTSTTAEDRVCRDDLHRIIRQGIPGTYMPSFLLLSDAELHAVTEYVRWLSMRGEFEKRLGDAYLDFRTAQYDRVMEQLDKRLTEARKANDKAEIASIDEERNDYKEEIEATLADHESAVDGAAGTVERLWKRAELPASVVVPKTPRTDPATDVKSIERGRVLYLSAKTKCVSCHGPAGRGDGPQTTDYQDKEGGGKHDQPGLFDDWGNPLKPRDLTAGIYRGGRRPVDLYRRIYTGIKGSKMPC